MLVGGFKHEIYFPFHIWDVILPIDELIFFKMVKTTNQNLCVSGDSDQWDLVGISWNFSGIQWDLVEFSGAHVQLCLLLGASHILW